MSGFNGDIPNRLKEAINSGKCILFVGSGLSANVARSNGKCLPLWKGLLEELLDYAVNNKFICNEEYCADIRQLINKGKLIIAAQELQKEVDKEMGTFLRSVFKDNALNPYEGHDCLSRIKCRAILTTNYDTLIEDAFKEARKPTVFTQNDLEDSAYALRENEFFVLHLHGHIDRIKTIVLGKRDYMAFHRKPEYKKFVETLFLSNTVLFIGFGCSDPDIDGIIDELAGVFSGQNPEHYALLPKGMNSIERNRLRQDKRLAVIEYQLDENEGHTQVTEFLKELSSFGKDDTSSSKSIDPPLRKRLLKASHEYHANLRGANGRFYHLKISDTILPHTSEQFIETSVKINNEGDMPLRDSLETLWDKEFKHTVIIGEGGMGKTVSLVRLWEKYIDEKQQDTPVPIFLALNEYNSANDEDKKNFIIKMIARNYLGKPSISKDSENALWGIFKKSSNGKPSIILLLDGFNEITVDKTGLLVELRSIIENAKGVQLVVTSRYDMRQNLNWNNLNRVDLLQLSNEQVKAYLMGKPMRGDKFLELVKNPMMLTLYTATSEIMDKHKNNNEFGFKKQVQSAGELLWNFIESQVVKVYDTYVQPDKKAYYKLLLKHMLPSIGFEMEKSGKFFLGQDELRECIDRAFRLFDCDEFFDTFSYCMDCEECINFGRLEGSEARKRFKDIKDILCKELIMLLDENGSFRFLHQHFRDFFAAVHVLNEVVMGLKSKRIPEVLREKTLSFYVRRFVGEIEREHYNKPILASNGWSIEHYTQTKLLAMLDMCRGIFDDRVGFTVWNIVEIWKGVRGELTGADLSNLNLCEVGLNGVRCSRWYKGRHIAVVRFDGCMINEKNIFSQGHSGEIISAVYSLDGRKILSCSWDNTIKEWSCETGECIKTYEGHWRSVNQAKYSKDGRKILSCANDKTIKEWDVETGECIKTYLGHLDVVNQAEYSEDGGKMLSCSDDNTIKEWNVETGECIKTYKGHLGIVTRAGYSQDGRRILSCSEDTTTKEWSCETGGCIKTYKGHYRGVNRAEYSKDGRKILSCSNDSTIKEWNIETGKCIKTYEGHSHIINRVEYSGDGRKILSCSNDKTIKEWSCETGECIKPYKGHSDIIIRAAYSGDGRRILSCSQDSTIKEWDVETGQCIKTYEDHFDSIRQAEYSKDGRRILSCSNDKTIKEWSVETGECIKTYKGYFFGVRRAEYSEDGRRILSCSSDKTIKEWDVETGECIKTYEGHSDKVNRAEYSEDGRRILSCSYDGTIKEWSVETGECIKTYEGHFLSVIRAEYSKDGRRILSCSKDNTIKEWCVETGECIKTYEGHSYLINREEYSRDGKRILSCFEDGTIKEWSVETGECIKTYEGHLGSVTGARYSKDGGKILSCSEDKTIKEWNVETGECIKTYEGHFMSINQAVYSNDERRILSCSYDGTIRQWDVQTEEYFMSLENIPGLLIQGCSFRNLHSTSRLSPESRRLLRMYGAIVDD